MKSKLSLFLIEFFILLCSFIHIFTPLTNYYFSADDGQSLCVSELPTLLMPSGSYRITIKQQVTAPSDAPDPTNAGATVGSLHFTSDTPSSAFYPITIEQKSGHDTAAAILTVKPFHKVSDLRITAEDSGMGSIQTQSISITGSRSYRVVCVIGLLIAVLFINFLIIKIKKQNVPSILCLGAIILIASLPLFAPSLYYGDDMFFHLGRIQGLSDALQAGQLPVHMQSSMLHGYGYPTSVFYGDILLYFPALLYLCAVPLQTVYKIYVIFINIGTALICYHVFRNIFEKRFYGIFGTFIYMLAPYRLTNIYTRAAVGEYSAMMFLPLVVYGFYRIFHCKKEKISLHDYLPLVIGLSGLIQTHMLSCEMSAVFIILFCILRIRDVFKPTVFLALLKSCALTLLVNVWFLVPFFDFMQDDYSIVASNYDTIQSYGISFHDVTAFFNGNYFTDTQFDTIRNSGLSFLFGCITVAFIVFSVIIARRHKEHSVFSNSFFCIMTFFSVLALCMTTAYFPWDIMIRHSGMFSGILRALQFPWRYLSLANLFLAFALPACLKQFSSRGIFLAITGVLCTGVFFFSMHTNAIPMQIYGQNDLDIMGTLLVANAEYLPAGTDLSLLAARETVSDENVKVTDLHYESGTTCFNAANTSQAQATIQIPVIYYRHYRAFDAVSKHSFPIGCSDSNMITVTLPADYSGAVQLAFHAPWFYRVAECVSVLSLIAIFISLYHSGDFSLVFHLFNRYNNRHADNKE